MRFWTPKGYTPLPVEGPDYPPAPCQSCAEMRREITAALNALDSTQYVEPGVSREEQDRRAWRMVFDALGRFRDEQQGVAGGSDA